MSKRERGRTMRFLAIGLVIAVWPAAGRALGQRAPFPIPDPDPEVERESFIVADGFEVNLYAADPMIHKPIQMNFDARGRLWIASSEVYPQIKPGQEANDKILIVEDSDGDGRGEKTSVFADGLLIPTGVEPGDGGVYVAASTELLHLKDTDGDGRADQRRVVLSGFGTEDTHHILHTLRWGHDGLLYFNQSIYIHSHVETPWGVRRLGGGGIWRFRPSTMELDVFIRGLVNPWGHHMDEFGQSFATDGAGGEGINYCLPGAYYTTAPDAVRLLPGLNPGSPKDCGLEIVSGRHLPEAWRGNLITCDFRGNRVCRYTASEDFAGYSAREGAELIKTRHMAFRPIDVKMGPDGAIYIADWYNPIIQHGEVDFRDDRRDHSRGRIWRVTARGRALAPRPRLVDAPADAVLDALRAPEEWTRRQAKRVLAERPLSEVLPRLDAWMRAIPGADPGRDHDRLEALWAYQAIGRLDPDLLNALLRSSDGRIRAAAVRVAVVMSDQFADPVALIGPRTADEHPRARLEAVRGLARFPTLRSAELALAALDSPTDPFLDYALWLTARQLAPAWLPEAAAGRFDFAGKPSRLAYALLAVGSPEVVKPLSTLLKRGLIPGSMRDRAEQLIAGLGDSSDLAVMLDEAVVGRGRTDPERTALLGALEKAARQRGVRPEGDRGRLAALIGNRDRALAHAAIRLAGAWKEGALTAPLIELATGERTTPETRGAAIEALVEGGGVEGLKAVESQGLSRGSRGVQAQVLSALFLRDPAALAPRAARWLVALPAAEIEPARLVLARVLERQGAPDALARALDALEPAMAPDLAKLLLRQARAAGREEPRLAAALLRSGRLAADRKPLTTAETAALASEVAAHGDPARGELVFRRSDLGCLKCHAIAGAGGQVGPGLESVGASAQVDYLIDSILEPSKAVKENYHSLVVATSDGKIHTGIKIRQGDRELVLRDANDAEDVIPIDSIDEQKPGESLMPAGLADGLTRGELVDLARFLSELGKVGAYAAGTERVFRAWRVLDARLDPSAADQVLQSTKGFEREKLAWIPAYATVAGLLPLAAWGDSPQPTRGAETHDTRLALTRLEVTTPGRVRLVLGSFTGLSVAIDGARATPSATDPTALELNLGRGVHEIRLALDPAARHDGVRCVLEDAPGSPARARVVLGK